MPNTGDLSKYLKVENVQDDDIITFVDAGVITTKEFKKGEPKKVLEITVQHNEDTRTYCPNGTTVKLLNEAWGTDTEEWVGKKGRIAIMPTNDGKKMIVTKPLAETARERIKAKNPQGDDEKVPF